MKYIDLFAGIGGIRLGYSNATGHECVFSSEMNKQAQATYHANFGETPHGDITKIDPASIPSFDTLLAGFPCQSFSMGGKRLGFNDPHNGALFWSIATILAYHKPRMVLLENVKGLLSHDGGNTFRTVVETLESLDYHVHWKVLSAKDFGLPQNRVRIYIVAFNEVTDFRFPKPTNAPTRVGDILEANVDPKWTLSDKTWQTQLTHKERQKAKGNGFGYQLFTEEAQFAPTLTVSFPNLTLLKQDGRNPRQLTIRERARLQGFPDSFVFPVTDQQAKIQLGNSVAVPVVEAISRKMAEAVKINSWFEFA